MADDAAAYLPAVRQLLQEADSRGLRLADCVVLLPNLQAAAPLTRALASASGAAWLLPPRWLTLPAWADTVPLAQSVMPESRRMALLHQSLHGRGWFDDDSLWPVCRELAHLFDELTLQQVDLPVDAARFEEQLTHAYQSRRQQGIGLEAALVHELWYAIMRPSIGSALPASLRYVLQLGRLAQTIEAPVFTLGLTDLNRAEQQCLAMISARAGVIPLAAPILRSGLEWVWPESGQVSLRERVEAWREPAAAWSERVRLTAARSLEHEAHCATWQIRVWLAAGFRHVAVIVQDRQTARRLRALLEREQILVRDETGWTLDTTLAAGLVMRWLEAVTQGFTADHLRNLLGGFPACAAGDAVVARQFERIRSRHPATAGLPAWLALAAAGDTPSVALQNWLLTLERAQSMLAGNRRSQSAWLRALLDSLTGLGLAEELTTDAAGQQVMLLLTRLADELSGHAMRFTLTEFRRWLADELAAQSFVDDSVDSPVLFTHLAATRLRQFDGVLFLGADETRLRPVLPGRIFFNQRVRSSLGLPGSEAVSAQIRADLIGVLGQAEQVRVLWTSEQQGATRQVASWFVRFNLLQERAVGASCFDQGLAVQASGGIATESGRQPIPPAPAVAKALLPVSISVSGLRRLVGCPYQYYASAILGLQDLEPDDPGLRKQDYGQLLHEVLYRFHQQVPVVQAINPDEARQVLIELSQMVFNPVISRDRQALGWLQRWLNRLDSYLDWQRAREASGWLWSDGEQTLRRRFALAEGREIELQGRIDRIDTQSDQTAVLDYKTSAAEGLRLAASQPDEDVQLAAYAVLLAPAEVRESAFLALDVDGGVREVPVAEGLEDAVHCLENRLVSVFERMHAGAGLPAHGAASVCERCEFTGLCRRPAWQGANPQLSSA